MWVLMYRSRALTGGDDGLSGIELRPIFGIFSFDMFGKTGFVYSLAVLTLCMFVLRLVMRSPFGLT
jgi:branched-chain amino acid transport system permease protein